MVAGVGICGSRCFSSRLFAFYDGQAWNDGGWDDKGGTDDGV